jgi:hypothetical protein
MADPSIPHRHLLSMFCAEFVSMNVQYKKCGIEINVMKFEDHQRMSSLQNGLHSEPILEVPHSSPSYIVKFDAAYTLVERVPTCKDEILCSI